MYTVLSKVVAYIYFPELVLLTEEEKKQASQFIEEVTGYPDYWSIMDEAKWVPHLRAQMEIALLNSKYRLGVHLNLAEFYQDHPMDKVMEINLEHRGISRQDIANLIQNGWLTGLVE